MLLLRDGAGRVLLEQRPPSGLWGGLWSLPQFDDEPALRAWLEVHAPGAELEAPWSAFTHVFSHFRLEITPQPARTARLDSVGEARRWYDPDDPDRIGLAAPVKRLLDTLSPFALAPPAGVVSHHEHEESTP
jgi:A/G-specific adenine glycosylase